MKRFAIIFTYFFFVANNISSADKLIDVIDKIDAKIVIKNPEQKQEANKNNSQKNVETYFGMVGDKRNDSGVNLDLTFEEKDNKGTLIIESNKAIDNNVIKTSLQTTPTRFFIDVFTKDNVVNFTYQMPRGIRLQYGKQQVGYRIAIDLPDGTKIINQEQKNNKKTITFQYNQNVVKERERIRNLSKIGDDLHFQRISLGHAKPLIVAVDAGHGGSDPGAIGKRKVAEKTITLMYAKSLRDKLEKLGVKVVMTRDADKTVALSNRVKIAREAKADIFISLHTDAIASPKVSGTTVYRLSHLDENHPDWQIFYNSSYLPKRYSKFKDKDKNTSNMNILDMLIGMSHQSMLEKSSIVVENIISQFKKDGICTNCRRGDQSLAVLRGLDMVSILIEIGYITNPEEEIKLLSASNVERFTDELARIISESFVV